VQKVSRRDFVGRAVAGAIGAGVAVRAAAQSADAQLVYTTQDWNPEPFERLVHAGARVKQVYDVTQIGEGKFLNNIKNSLNGLHFGFGIPVDQIQVVGALHGPANMLNFDDSVWSRYRIGEWLGVTDPHTGQPATRNPFYASPVADDRYPSNDPDSMQSPFQDTSMQALQRRGVVFLSCHTATEEQARALIRRFGLTQDPETIVRDMLAHVQPGVLVVAAMVAAIALLQSDGRYTYITV
jgi:hypothetical protein